MWIPHNSQGFDKDFTSYFMNQGPKAAGWNRNSNGLLWEEYKMGTELKFQFTSPDRTYRTATFKRERMQTFTIQISTNVKHRSIYLRGYLP